MSNENKSENTLLTRLLTVIIPFLALVAFIILTCVQINWIKDIRKRQIKPEIILTEDISYILGINNIIYLSYKNIGNGSAHNIILVITESSNISPIIVEKFDVRGNGNYYEDQNFIMPEYIGSCHVKLRGFFGEEFINFSSEEKFNKMKNSELSIYFSYFDRDGNEYVTITKHSFNDSIQKQHEVNNYFHLKLELFSKDVSCYSYKIIDNPGLRSDNKWFDAKFYDKPRDEANSTLISK